MGKCEIIINKEKKKLNEYYEYVYNKKETIGINIIINEAISDLSYMFSNCTSLLSISNTLDLDTYNVINMRTAFYG